MRYHYEKPTSYSSIFGSIYTCDHNFKEFFDDRSGPATDGLYPTVTIRQIMWALKMKPIPRERWETCFDRRDI